MEPLAQNIEFLLPLRDCRQVYCHFEKVFQRENAAPPSRSPCRADPKRMRAQIRKLRVISSKPLDASSGPAPGCAVADK